MTTPINFILSADNSPKAYLVEIPPEIPRQISRWHQARAIPQGLQGGIQARLKLAPRRGQPELAEVLELSLANSSHTANYEIPTEALSCFLRDAAEALREKEGLKKDDSISYAALMPKPPDSPIVWEGRLPSFRFTPGCGDQPNSPLFPHLDWHGDIPVRMNTQVLLECINYCQDASVERGGALLGNLRFHDRDGLSVEILAFAPADGAQASQFRLTFDLKAWEAIEQQRVAIERKLGLDEPLQVCGWAHGHPRLESSDTPGFFLSAYDRRIMSQHFSEPFSIAVVVDAGSQAQSPLDKALMVFGWDRYGVDLTPRSLHIK